MLNWKWSSAIAIAAIVILAFAAMFHRYEPADGLSVKIGGWTDFFAWLGIGSPSTQPGPDDVIVFDLKDKSDPKVGVRLGIPRKYLHSVEVSSWSKIYRFTTIEAVMPDMRPGSSRSGRSSIKNPTPEQLDEWRNQVSIEWVGGEAGGQYSAMNHYEILTRERALVTETGFGLQHFRRRVCWGEGAGQHARPVKEDIPGMRCEWHDSDVFTFPPSGERQWVSYRCTDPGGAFHGRCRANTLVRGWGIEYSFDRRELPRWRDLEDAIRRLMESFFIAGEQIKKR